MPVPVLIESDDVPADAVTGADTVANAGTIDAFVADAETTVPVSRPVRAIRKASAESTELSAGTGSTVGFDAITPVDTDDPPTERAVDTAADAGRIARTEPVKAAAMTTAVFLNEFIYFPFLIYIRLNLSK